MIGCDTLASGVDADWLDLSWGEGSDGGAARFAVILRDIPGMGRDLGAGRRKVNEFALVMVDRGACTRTRATPLQDG